MLDILSRKDKGTWYEQKACKLLKNAGLSLLQKNYHCPFGEIDLIMRDKDEIVFIEVRGRTKTHFACALESIDSHKQKKLLKSAQHYLHTKNWIDKVNCRFDVVGFNEQKTTWIKDAFSYE